MTEAAEAQLALPDPRAYGNDTHDGLAMLAAAAVSSERGARSALVAAMRERLALGDDAAIFAAFADAPRQSVRLRLLEALKVAIDDPAADEADGLLTRIFAIPVLFVAAGLPGTGLPGNVPDVAALAEVLRQHGALGQTENFGLSAALVAVETLEALAPSVLYRWTRSIGQESATPRELAATDITIDSREEHVHLRFLVGAGVTSAHGLSFVETASRIGAWGMPMTRELAAQLGQDGVSLLPLPRPPKSLVVAAPAGAFALAETRLQLFVTNALRRLRASVGEPVAVLSAHASGELRLGFSSPFDEGVRVGFRWPLGAFDDLGEVVASILSLLRDCHVSDVRIVPGLQSDLTHSLSVHDLGPSGEVRH